MSRTFKLFRELARLYFPGCTTDANAVRCLSRQIARCTPLREKLLATGYAPYNHRLLTPRQVELIVAEFGCPYDEPETSLINPE